jgi:hypothetical protein
MPAFRYPEPLLVEPLDPAAAPVPAGHAPASSVAPQFAAELKR